MSVLFQIWPLAALVLGAIVWTFTLVHLLRLYALVRAATQLRPGPVELFGQLVLCGPPLSSPAGAALVYRHRQAVLAGEEDTSGTELAWHDELQAAQCELRTPYGRAVLDFTGPVSDVKSSHTETRKLEGAELQSEPCAQLVARAENARSASVHRPITYRLTETVLHDGALVLVLADAVALPAASAAEASPRWQLCGRPGSPLVVREGSRLAMLGGDALWLVALALLGSICLYYGFLLLQAGHLYQTLPALFSESART